MQRSVSRRSFLKSTGCAVATLTAPSILSARSPNETVRLAGVGVGGKGWVDINGAAEFGKVIAFCDIDTRDSSSTKRRGGYQAASEKWPHAKAYIDFRKLIEEQHQNLDGITISTPDHMHAPITMMALQHGLAVYTQKPLTRTIYESRRLTEVAAEKQVSTQMGNQHHSGAGYLTLVNIIQEGLIGKIREAHAWSNRPIWPQGLLRPEGSKAVPDGLNWDLWLGVAQSRSYLPDVYHPFKWRGWFDFGAGALGDMGCHIIDPVVWALGLEAPMTISYSGPKPMSETFPKSETLTYRFPGTQYTSDNPFMMKWYDGGRIPSIEGSHLTAQKQLPSQGVLFIGEKGSLTCGHGKMPNLYPLQQYQNVELPIENKLNHYEIWVNGIRNGDTPNSNFSYAGPLTETVLLGVIASRIGESAGELQWDAKGLRFKNSDQATNYVREQYRDGWGFDGLT